MAETVAVVIDLESLNGCARRLWGLDKPGWDILKLLHLIKTVPNPRTLLWVKVIMLEPPEPSEQTRQRHDGFCRFLRHNCIRFDVVRRKPINRVLQRHEQDACDFAIVEALDLASRKASTIVLAAGDGHLRHAVRKAANDVGCRVEIMCDRQALSSDLEADYFYFLDELVKRFDLEKNEHVVEQLHANASRKLRMAASPSTPTTDSLSSRRLL